MSWIGGRVSARLVLSVLVGGSMILGSGAGCSSLSVKTDYDRSVDFTRYETYDWRSERPRSPRRSNQPPATRSLLDKRVQSAVDAELAAKGFRRQTGGQPDLVVTYHAGVEDRVQVTETLGRRGFVRDVDVHHYKQGTLVLDFIDPARNELVWRGWGSGAVGQDPKLNEAKVQEAVVKILERFPPER